MGRVREFIAKIANRATTGPMPAMGTSIAVPGFEFGTDLGTLFASRDIPRELFLTIEQMLDVSPVWPCLNCIANDIAGKPIRVYQRGADGRRELLPDDNVVYLLNVKPNPMTTALALKQSILFQAQAYGNGFWELVYDEGYRLKEIWPLLTERMKSEQGPDGELIYRYRREDGTERILLDYQVFHLRNPSLNGMSGESTLVRARRSITLAYALDQFGLSYFGNGAVLSTILSIPAGVKVAAENIDILRKQFSERHAGPGRGHKPFVAPDGMDVKMISSGAKDAQLIEARQVVNREIAGQFHVPLQKLGDPAGSQGYGTNLNLMRIEYVGHAIDPLRLAFEIEANIKLFSPRSYREVVVDVSDLLRGDAVTTAQANAIKLDHGVININEWREADGLDGIGTEGEDRIIKAGYQLLESVSEPLATPAAVSSTGSQGDEASSTQSASEDRLGPSALALQSMAASVLDDHLSRLSAREADLRKNLKNGDLRSKMDEAVQQSRKRASEKLDAFDPRTVEAALAAAEQGGGTVALAAGLVDGLFDSQEVRS